VQADAYHRGHAIIEQVIAELKAGPLAHLPSGKFAANTVWPALAVIAFNIARAAAVAAGLTKIRMATLLRILIGVPARLTFHRPPHCHAPTQRLGLAGRLDRPVEYRDRRTRGGLNPRPPSPDRHDPRNPTWKSWTDRQPTYVLAAPQPRQAPKNPEIPTRESPTVDQG
jgi:hypothetical protein